MCVVANTTFETWASCFKIGLVTMFPPGDPTAGGPKIAQVSWATGESAQVPDELKLSVIPEGVTLSNSVRFKPPAKSLAGFWITTADAAADVMTITCPAGTIVDLQIAFRLSNALPQASVAIATGTVGVIYYLALDGPSSNSLVPVGLSTTH